MPRKARLSLPEIACHAYVRGNNHQETFRDDSDRLFFRECLRVAARERGLAIHAYVFMTNHIHLLATGSTSISLALTIQDVGRRYVRYFNARHGRSGTLWEGRFKSMLVDSESYYLNAHRYIEQNPVRARMVRASTEYIWSSHRHFAMGVPDDLVTPHSAIAGRFETLEAYREYCEEALSPEVLEAIRNSARLQLPYGSEAFCRHIGDATGLPSVPRKRGPARQGAGGEVGEELVV